MTDYHSLSPDQFRALARGAGGADAIAVLRAGQASKHVVMLITILDLLDERHPDLLATADDQCRLLDAAQRADPDAAATVVAHPQFGLWASRCLRQLNGNATLRSQPIGLEVGQLGAFAAVAARAAGLEFEVTVPARDGTVMLPTLGLARPGDGDTGPATVVYRDGQMRIRSGGSVVTVPADPTTDAPGWVGQRYLSGTAAGRTATVELVDLGPARDGRERTDETRVDDATLGRWRRVFQAAWHILGTDHPTAAEALATGLVGIIPLENDEDSVFSATMRDAFGYLESKLSDDPLLLAETLVHEFHHSKLYGVLDLFPLHESAGEHIHFAPWRQDPRPLPGLLQGAYSFMAVTDFWSVQLRSLTGRRRDRAYYEFARWQHQVVAAIDVLLGSGELTAAGTEFVETMRQTTRCWGDEQVPAEIQRWADRYVTDHRVVWRLANLHPDPNAVARLVEDRIAGRDCVVDVRSVPRDIASDGVVRRSERRTLTQLRLDDPDRFQELLDDERARAAAGLDEVGVADVAYLRGDLDRAADLFRDAIARCPDRYQNWSGLAVCRSDSALLRDAPEVVLAVARGIRERTGTAPDVVELADWLACPLTAAAAWTPSHR